MKKALVFMILFFSFIVSLNAVCDNTRQKEYNVLSGYVSYKIDYVESRDLFSVTFYNLADGLLIGLGGNKYYGSNNEVVVSNLGAGQQLKFDVMMNDSECGIKSMRTITVNIPYVNKYYNDPICEGHEELNACSSKFLDYQVTKSSIISLINRTSIDNSKNESSAAVETQSESIFESIMEWFSGIIFPLIIVTLSSIISILIFLPIYRKVKYGM